MALNFKNTVGYGVLIWVLVFVVVSAFIGFKIYYVSGIEVVVSLIGAILVFIFAGYAKPKNLVQALAFGFSWAVVGIVLDYLITMRFNPGIFQTSIWLNYLLGVLVPVLRIKKQA